MSHSVLIMSKLTKEQMDRVIKMQLLYEKNYDIRPYTEIAVDIPPMAAKSMLLTTTFGSALTWGSSFFVFRKLSIANSDVAKAFPVLTAFSAMDFGVNFTLTKLCGRRSPERWMSVASSATAGGVVGYHLGNKKVKPTIAGCVLGGLYGYVRNYPLDLLGYEPF